MLAACSQDKGESCQVNRDCASGLQCSIAAGNDRGECVDPADFENATAATDAGPDAEVRLPPDDGGAADEDGG